MKSEANDNKAVGTEYGGRFGLVKRLSFRCRNYQVGLALLGCLQNSCFAGILFGWASIDRTLLAASSENGGANLTLQETTRIFSLSSSVAMISTLVMGGLILDKYGPRVCSMISHIIIGVGCVIFATASNFAQFAIGACLISLGGPGVQISVINFANLFPNNHFLALNILCGTICVSFAVLEFFNWLWEVSMGTISYSMMFGGLAVVSMVSMVASAIFYPDQSYEDTNHQSKANTETLKHHTPQEEYFEAATAHHYLIEQPIDSFLRSGSSADSNKELENRQSYKISKHALLYGEASMISLKDRPFRQQLFSGCYIRILLVFVVTSFLANFYIASFSTEMTDSKNFEVTVQNRLASIFTLMMSTGSIGSIVVGWIMDQAGLEICTLLTLLLGQAQVWILVLAGRFPSLMIISFALYVSFRQFLYPVYMASITSKLGFKYFGLLNGIGFALSGVVQGFMSSLVAATKASCEPGTGVNAIVNADGLDQLTIASSNCHQDHWTWLHVCEIVVLMAMLLIPYFDRRERQLTEIREKQFLERKRLFESSSSSISASTSSKYGAMLESVREEEEHLV